MNKVIFFFTIITSFLFVQCTIKQKDTRHQEIINGDWRTILVDSSFFQNIIDFKSKEFDDKNWKKVEIPHNWDQYYGFRRERHGNLHGQALYRKSIFIPKNNNTKAFLFFEAVGSYSTIWLNEIEVGHHAGGKTSFTIDITDAVKYGEENQLTVLAEHPSDIRDLPWVCGGCSPEWGFSEGSQPLGVFRPVHLIMTNDIKIEPFGVHLWNDSSVNTKNADIYVNSELKNYSQNKRTVTVENILFNAEGKKIKTIKKVVNLQPNETVISENLFTNIKNPILWNLENPYLYDVETYIYEDGKVIDKVTNKYGIRWVKWDVEPVVGKGATNRFYLNGEPVFINGTAEYEHLMGNSHSFAEEMVYSRTEQVRSAGFNLFRDAHQPHNFRYQERWDEIGMLWWPQMSAHIWFDNPDFRENFKARLRDFVKERRNNPSNVIWGLQNESTLPEDFARECSEIIRELDPTASTQRVVTTCNGGTGTDWNVIQNWSGTYGGDPYRYDKDMVQQIFNGEYGAWRTTDLHTTGEFDQNGIHSEYRMCQLMNIKLSMAEKVSDSICGHIQWLFASHENPGRIQSGEGMRELDKVGPVNNKGLFTIWGEPTSAYYMYRANYADKYKEPMVYIYGHNWADRFISTGVKDSITIFSNCDEVELFNTFDNSISLGKKENDGKGTFFIWNKVNIQTNILKAVGYVNNIAVAEDVIQLNHLPKAETKNAKEEVITTDENSSYIYRINCGGDVYTDGNGHVWEADVNFKNEENWGSTNWTDNFEEMSHFFGSQRYTNDPIKGTLEQKLFQTFRYGNNNQLKYHFPVENGRYKVELYFVEPWYGIGGGLNCEKWRVFDVAINENVLIKDFDIWNEVGVNQAIKKTFYVDAENGKIEISFPKVNSSQAIISAIAISTTEKKEINKSRKSVGLISKVEIDNPNCKWERRSWLKTGELQFKDEKGDFYQIPPNLEGAEWISLCNNINNRPTSKAEITVDEDVIAYIAIEENEKIPSWLLSWKEEKEIGKLRSTFNKNSSFNLYSKEFRANEKIILGKKDDGVMYSVIIVYKDSMVLPIDMRETVRYRGYEAKLKGPNAKIISLPNNKKSVEVSDIDSEIEFDFEVGLASVYGIDFRFMNLTNNNMPVKMEILSFDGIIQWEGEIEFISSPAKWKTKKTDTHTTINAGKYKLRLKTLKKGQLIIDWLNIQ